ncbi:MAG: hypothetical protein ACLS27_07570 [Eubacterium sp.]
MKIFKHRGDIYISKSSGKKSREEHILLIMLAIIVIFTVVFFAILSQKYSSVKEFFAGDSVTVTQQANNGVEELPQISGKSNFLIIETDGIRYSLCIFGAGGQGHTKLQGLYFVT